MNKESLVKYFPEINSDEKDYRDKGYTPLLVSVFDHVLSEQEADDCSVLSYSISLAKESVESYFEGERKFISLYTRLASESGLLQVSMDYSSSIVKVKSASRARSLINSNIRGF